MLLGSEMYGVHIGEIREASTVSSYDVFEIVRNDVRFTKFRIVYLSRLAKRNLKKRTGSDVS